MNIVVIGSSAVRHWFPDFPRDPKDVDVAHDGVNVELGKLRIAGKRAELLFNPVLFQVEHEDMFLKPDYIYTLKISHLFHDIFWEKHAWDVQWLKAKGCQVDWPLLEKLHAYWSEVHPKVRKSNLAMTPESFFNNAITCPVPHDELHERLAETPAYKKILKNNGTVETDDDLFDSLSLEEKLDVVREETMVMAYERLAGRSYKAAYAWMLKKLILNHLPFRQGVFAIQHHKELIRAPFDYVKKLEQAEVIHECR